MRHPERRSGGFNEAGLREPGEHLRLANRQRDRRASTRPGFVSPENFVVARTANGAGFGASTRPGFVSPENASIMDAQLEAGWLQRGRAS